MFWTSESGNNENLTSLPKFPDSIERVNCKSCKNLTSIPELPRKLIDLFCDDNQITLLPALPKSLHILECNDNLLSVLPALPERLYSLICSNNQITQLPTLPPGLTELVCENNQITRLPTLPASIKQLRCSGNNIVQIDDLSLLRIYVEINTDNLNLDSLIKYRDYLLRIYGNRIPDRIQAILHNIAERIDLKNFELVSGKNKEIIVPGLAPKPLPGAEPKTVRDEAIKTDLIKSFITDRKAKGTKSRKRKTISVYI